MSVVPSFENACNVCVRLAPRSRLPNRAEPPRRRQDRHRAPGQGHACLVSGEYGVIRCRTSSPARELFHSEATHRLQSELSVRGFVRPIRTAFARPPGRPRDSAERRDGCRSDDCIGCAARRSVTRSTQVAHHRPRGRSGASSRRSIPAGYREMAEYASSTKRRAHIWVFGHVRGHVRRSPRGGASGTAASATHAAGQKRFTAEALPEHPGLEVDARRPSGSESDGGAPRHGRERAQRAGRPHRFVRKRLSAGRRSRRDVRRSSSARRPRRETPRPMRCRPAARGGRAASGRAPAFRDRNR